MSETADKIEQKLKERFEPFHLELRDDSARHAGRRGATSGGGHYHALIVSGAFDGCSLLDRHRFRLLAQYGHSLGSRSRGRDVVLSPQSPAGVGGRPRWRRRRSSRVGLLGSAGQVQLQQSHFLVRQAESLPYLK